MNSKIVGLIIVLVASLLGLTASQTDALEDLFLSKPPAGMYRVVEISDGDTIVVDMNGTDETIRFIGVDTPETHHPNKPVQCFGKAASQYTASRINKFVRLEADPESDNRDRYSRLLRYVYSDQELLNLALITDGYGFAYRSFPHSKQPAFIEAEEQARANQVGLWSGCDVELNEYGSYEAPPAN